MRYLNILLLIIFCLTFSACKRNLLAADEYISFIEDQSNPYFIEKKIGNMVFQLQYCSTEYLLIKQLKTNEIPSKLLEEKIKENKGLVFFKLRIATAAHGDVLNYELHSQDDYFHRIDYLSYGFEEDIALVNGVDTTFPGLFQFERTYGISPNADFLIAFDPKIKKDEEFQVVIDDKVFNNGLIKFSYDQKDIENIPQLKTN